MPTSEMIETLPALNQKRGNPGMAKPPYFPFFYQDFFQGTKHFSLAQRGAYLEMISDCWEIGIIKEKHFAHLRGQLLPEEFGEILAKFQGVKGGFKHEKVETIRKSVNERSEIAKRNGLLGGFHKHSKEVAKEVANEVANPVANTVAKKKLLKSQILNLKSQSLNLKKEGEASLPEAGTEPTLKRKTRWPKDFILTEERRQYAIDQGIGDPEAEWETMRLKDLANGYRKIDWNAFWQTWCRSSLTKKTNLTEGEEPYDP